MYQSGNLVKQARESKNITQRELARRIGIENPTISNWERGKDLPSMNMGISIANALGIPIDEISNMLIKERAERDKQKSIAKYKSLSATINIETDMSAQLTANENDAHYLNKLKLISIPILGQVPAGSLQEILPKMRS
jgi:transcriptional regulator with XRE-family HTH domain